MSRSRSSPRRRSRRTGAPLLHGVRRTSTRCATSEFREEHLEYLLPTPHADWGAGVAERGAPPARSSPGPDVVNIVLALHRRGRRARFATSRARRTSVSRSRRCSPGASVCARTSPTLPIAMCRSIGMPARYVSGYLFTTNDATGEDPDAEAVRVQTHAWFEAACPGVGWLALDPTNATEVGLAAREDRARPRLQRRAAAARRVRAARQCRASASPSTSAVSPARSAADARRASAAAAQQRLDEARASGAARLGSRPSSSSNSRR